jgi:predicted amidophosphoribosyltransferase
MNNVNKIPPHHHLKLSHCEGFEKVWFMGYYFRWPTSDYISRQVMDFKRGDLAPREAFGDLAAQEFEMLGRQFDYVTRMLGSKELVALKGNKVAAIATKIADTCGQHYHPNLVRKSRLTRELKYLNKGQRKAEMEDVYKIYKAIDLNNKKVLIVDDVFTFGTSFEAIGDVLRHQNPDVRLFGFALVHNWQRGTGNVNINEADFIERYTKAFRKAA